jgi:enolase-phosphatase E1
MTNPVQAVLIDLEGVAIPMAFATETLTPLARERLGAFIAENASNPEVEEALEETGRLLGGFDLKPAEAVALLLRWMKQERKATPLKTIQGLIWRESFETGAIKGEIYPDVGATLAAWAAAGLRLFVYSSNSTLAQQLLLRHGPAGDLTPLFEAHFDTSAGAKNEPASYRAICAQVGLPAEAVMILSENEEELDAARSVGLATTRIARENVADSRHPVSRDLASLKFGA